MAFRTSPPASVNVLATIDPRFTNFNPKRQQNATLTWTRFLTNTALNELRVSYNRDVFNRATGFKDTGWSNLTELGIPGQTEDPHDAAPTGISVTGCCGFGASEVNNIWDESRMVADHVSFIKGNHNIKMGMEFNLVHTARRTIRFTNGSFRSTACTPVWGSPTFCWTIRSSFVWETSPASLPEPFRTCVIGAFTPISRTNGNSRPNLTMNIGVRWEYNSPFRDKRGESRNLDLGTGQLFPAPGMTADLNTVSKNNWAPRFGIAWRPFGGTGFVIRTGYGIFYNVNMINNFVPILAANPPGSLRIEETSLARRPIITMATADQAQSLISISSVSGAATDHTVGFVQQWNFNIQKSLPWDLVAEVGYSGSKSDHFDLPAEYNAFLPSTIGTANPIRRYTNLSSIEIHDSGASGNYHGLLSKLERRFSGGVTFLQTYTWAYVQ